MSIASAKQADLSITKWAPAGPHLLGQDLVYMLAISNMGPSDASGVIVVDFLPPGATFLSVTSDLCQCAISNDVVRCDTRTNAIPAGSGAGVEILVRLDMVTVLTNKAIVTSGSALDPDVQDNVVSIETTVLPAANLALTKTGAMVSIVAGSNLTYTISISNAGPSTADNVLIVDSLPPGVLLQAGSTNVSLGSLAPGSSTSVVLQVTVNPGTLGMITNTASANSDTGDPYPANNMDTVETTIIALADLSVEKLASVNPVIAGSNMTYTISVTNSGPSDALDVLVADMLPVGLTPTGSVMSNLGAIVAGGSSQFVINVGVSPAALGPITNIATLTSLTADPNTTNNTDAEVTVVIVVSDLEVSLSDMPDPAIAGSNVYYIAAITNEGTSDATNIFARIGVPAGTSTNALPPAWLVDTNFPGSGATVVAIPIESMVAGASTSVTLCLNIDPSFLGTLTNSVIVTVSTDPDSPFADFDQVETFVSAAADIQLFKTASTNPVVSGLGLMYSLVVSNSGPSLARNVVATDPLPSGVVPNDVVVTNLGNIAPGGYVLIDIPVIVKPGLATGALLTNTASASSAAADAVPANNVATVVVSVVAISDLSITKEDSPDPVVDSDVLVYTITVSNAGPSDAANVLLSDDMPSGITPSGSIVTNIGWLQAGAVTSIVITVQVHGNTTGTITNRAEVSSASMDTNTTGNIVFEDTTIPDFDGDGEADFSDADDDNDGMPDDFENEHDLDPKDSQDADDDPDMDTHSNLEEYIADTDPTNGLSFFNISALAVTNSIRVFFDSSTGRVYTLQYIDDLAGGFFTNYPEHTGKPGQGGTDSFLDTNNAPDRYYRIEVELP